MAGHHYNMRSSSQKQGIAIDKRDLGTNLDRFGQHNAAKSAKSYGKKNKRLMSRKGHSAINYNQNTVS